MVKRLRLRPLTPATRVRFPHESPTCIAAGVAFHYQLQIVPLTGKVIRLDDIDIPGFIPAIARALAAAPAIILADEPTGNLDSRTSQDVLSLLKVTSQKFAQTIVMITHNEEIAQTADRIIRIEDGRIVR